MDISIAETITFGIKCKGKSILNGIFAQEIPVYIGYTVTEHTSKSVCIEFTDYATLSICYTQNEGTYKVSWESCNTENLGDAFSLLSGHWYGAGHVFDQPWPLEKWNTQLGPFVTGEPSPFTFGIYDQYYGGLQERYWLCSSGIAIFADFDIPLFVSTNYEDDNYLKFVSKYNSPYQNNKNIPLRLSYTLLQSTDAYNTHLASINTFFKKPQGIPSERMFQLPIWSTWAQYKKDINQDNVLEFANNIKKYGFKNAQLAIDDDWTPHYGDFDFDRKKFPQPQDMIKELKAKGFRVTLWMHPFISPTAKTFWEYFSKKFWVSWSFMSLPAIASWWNGFAAQIDMTDPDLVSWYNARLQFLKNKYAVDSFKFDAGDAFRLSSWTRCKQQLDNPNVYTKLYVENSAAADTDLRAQEVRVGTNVQHLPMFFRLQDKDSNWGQFNGIKTVIPHMLTQGLIGYPFVLPDMIGGNAYGMAARPEKELYIRWMEMTALMPAMQFSVVPWSYDSQVITIAHSMCNLHEQYSKKIIELAGEAVHTGIPICRPVWWLDPNDETALTISTEFLLGDDILVAPVLDAGAVSRDIYLPHGSWVDAASSNILQGGQWHRNYPAPLQMLPYFQRM